MRDGRLSADTRIFLLTLVATIGGSALIVAAGAGAFDSFIVRP